MEKDKITPKAEYGTLKYFQQLVAIEHEIGENLVMGHKKSYFDKASYLHTKFHVKAALEAAAEKAKIIRKIRHGEGGGRFEIIDKQSILSSYDLNEIK